MVRETRAETGWLCLGEPSTEEGEGYGLYPLVCRGERYGRGWVDDAGGMIAFSKFVAPLPANYC